MKRKPSRRANTAERRATHNAVERQRRETLNGRFLDLAGLLPNLSQIRRPSKSSIVNSSIAHIQASRRHRLLASRELRLLKHESDTLRRELNDWRSRSNLPIVEEPVRGEGFAMVLSGEIEVLTAIGDEDEENSQDYDGFDEGSDEFAGNHNMGIDDSSDQYQIPVPVIKTPAATTFAPKLTSNVGVMAHLMPSCGPIIAPSPTNVSFENPAMASLYEPAHHSPSSQQQMSFLQQLGQESVDKWSSSQVQQLYPMQPQRNLFAPSPSSIQPLTPPPSALLNSSSPFNDSFFAALQRQQQQNAMQQGGGGNMGHVYGSPVDGDDASQGGGSVLSGGGRQRSGSGSNTSNGYLTPPRASGSFDFSSVIGGGDTGRRSSGLQINTGAWRSDVEGGGMGPGVGVGMGINSFMKQNMNQPISVGGGGGGGGYMSAMY